MTLNPGYEPSVRTKLVNCTLLDDYSHGLDMTGSGLKFNCWIELQRSGVRRTEAAYPVH